jgi:sugar/nucleoside kinase (ribokinase family)
VTAQGWLRRVLADGRIETGHPESLPLSALAGRVTVVILSREDLGGAEVPPAWLGAFAIVIITAGGEGLRLWHAGRWWFQPAFPARERDATGAGDAFAAGFLICYAETGDIGDAARFGAATASFVVEGPGFATAPDQAAVECRLRSRPEIRLSRLAE